MQYNNTIFSIYNTFLFNIYCKKIEFFNNLEIIIYIHSSNGRETNF